MTDICLSAFLNCGVRARKGNRRRCGNRCLVAVSILHHSPQNRFPKRNPHTCQIGTRPNLGSLFPVARLFPCLIRLGSKVSREHVLFFAHARELVPLRTVGFLFNAEPTICSQILSHLSPASRKSGRIAGESFVETEELGVVNVGLAHVDQAEERRK